jgi:hypothetical protein
VADAGDVMLGAVALAAAGAVGYYVYRQWKQRSASGAASASASASAPSASGPTPQPGAQPTPSYSVTFNESGLPLGWTWCVNLGGAQQCATNWGMFGGYNITFDNVSPNTYYFTIPTQGSYVPSPASGSVTVSDSNPNPVVRVVFSQVSGGGGGTSAPPQQFTVTFRESGLPDGTTWYVNLGGQDYYATAPDPIVVQITGATAPVSWRAPVLYGGWNVLGFYTWKWVPNPDHGTVASAQTVNITYTGTYNI